MKASHASLADRMGYIEEHMGDSFEKHAKASMAKLLCKVPLLGDLQVYGMIKCSFKAVTCDDLICLSPLRFLHLRLPSIT